MKKLGVGLVGSGFMGRSHSHAFRAVHGVFDVPLVPVLELIADADDALAEKAKTALGFNRSTGDWRRLIADPAVDLVDITTPNTLHKEIALAAIAAGKPVYCEKPLAPNALEARQMVDAAERAGVKTAVGFNYLKNPMVALAREIVASGEIGEVISFRGIHAEDYMTDPNAPFTWRLDEKGGHGVVADLGSHIISIARYVVGPIDELVGQIETVVNERPTGPNSSQRRKVLVDDEARAIVRFRNGATGTIEASWVKAGRKMMLAFEVTGSKGTILVDHERMNELELYTTGQPSGREGFKKILAGPAQPHFREFVPAPGHQLGFNDIKTIEVRALIAALAGGPAFQPDFREAWEIQRVVDGIVISAREKRWLNVSEV
ncbi:MAG TPA: Gfo/Idh/MocA family oxidoreductase [Bauldia sp.]|nr:Gfo/Idh/MocA family oxidoreductase [Bauldia sp.]